MRWLSVVAWLLALAVLTTPRPVFGNTAGGMRTWASVSGATIEARLVRVEDETVILEREDGSRLSIALRLLSPDDVEWVRAQAAPAVSGEPSKPDELPVFESGPWTGSHAVYRHALFDATMDARGVLHVQLKEQGRPVGPSLRYALQPHYHGPDWTSRRIVSFNHAGPPVMQPELIRLEGKLEHEVPFEVTFEFKDNEISAWGRCEDPPRLSFPTRYRMLIGIPASHDIDPSMPQDRRAELLAGSGLRLRAADGSRLRWEHFNYHDPQMNFSRAVREVRIEAAPWKPRTIVVSTPSRDVPLRTWIYRGNALWQGYSIHLTKTPEQGPSRSPRDRIVLTIE